MVFFFVPSRSSRQKLSIKYNDYNTLYENERVATAILRQNTLQCKPREVVNHLYALQLQIVVETNNLYLKNDRYSNLYLTVVGTF